jgi:WD40 repeat protein
MTEERQPPGTPPPANRPSGVRATPTPGGASAGRGPNSSRIQRWRLEPGASPIPGYQLVGLIGEGGFGQVWKANGPGGFAVAIKFVKLGAKAEEVEKRALELMRDIRHAHLLIMFGAWQAHGYLAVAMELADRTLLDEYNAAVQRGWPGIPVAQLLEYLGEAAKGIDHLNHLGIQHRDLKPQNLFLVGGSVKVGDFGMAKLVDQGVTSHTGSAMTPAYAAPEFFSGKTSLHSDQYALAVTYCQLRYGRLPFDGTAAQVMAGHLFQEPDLSFLGDAERAIVARALHKEPALRWPSCRAFIKALAEPNLPGDQRTKDWMAGLASTGRLGPEVRQQARALAAAARPLPEATPEAEPGPALAPPAPRTAYRPVKKRPPVALFLILLLAGAGVTGWFYLHGQPPPARPAPTDTRTAGDGFPVPGEAPLRRSTGPQAVTAVAWLNRGQFLTTTQDGRLFRWGMEKERPLFEFRGRGLDRATAQEITCLAILPDGRQLMTGGADGTVRLWDLETAQELRVVGRHASAVKALALSPKGDRVATASEDKTVRLWDLSRADPPAATATVTLAGWATAVAWSPDGAAVAVAGDRSKVRLFDAAGGKLKERPELAGPAIHVHALTFSRDGARLIAAADDQIRQWRADSGGPLPDLQDQATALATDPDGKTLVTAGGKFVKEWRLDKSINLGDRSKVFADPVTAVAVAPDGPWRLCGCANGDVYLWAPAP